MADLAQVLGRQTRCSQGLGGEVVDQLGRAEAAGAAQAVLGDPPVEVGHVDLAVIDRTGHGDHRLVGMANADLAQIVLDGVLSRGVVLALVGGGFDQARVLTIELDQGEAGVGAADIADEAETPAMIAVHDLALPQAKTEAPASAAPTPARIHPNSSLPKPGLDAGTFAGVRASKAASSTRIFNSPVSALTLITSPSWT